MALSINKTNISELLTSTMNQVSTLERYAEQIQVKNAVSDMSATSLIDLYNEVSFAVSVWDKVIDRPDANTRANEVFEIPNFVNELQVVRQAALNVLQWIRNNTVSPDGSINIQRYNSITNEIETNVISPGDIDPLIVLLQTFRNTINRN